jgi:hypothetical protein
MADLRVGRQHQAASGVASTPVTKQVLGTDMRETLKKNTEGYDQRMQVESVRRLMETMAALKDWESGA